MSKDVIVQDNQAITEHNFEQLLNPDRAIAIANTLKGYATKQGLVSNIQGKVYAHVEAWQYAGSLIGLFPMVVEVVDLTTEKEFRWKATVEIRNNDGEVKARGTAICSNKESKRRNADEYAICSMAQTRATGKAFRLLIGWMFKLADLEPTPAEEMEKDDPTVKHQGPTAGAIRKEYQEFAYTAIQCCPNASDVEDLVKLASILKESDPKFIDLARKMYKLLADVTK